MFPLELPPLEHRRTLPSLSAQYGVADAGSGIPAEQVLPSSSSLSSSSPLDPAYNPAYIRILPRTSSLSAFRKSCETCGVEHDGSFGAGRFCSSRCARTVGGLAHRKKRLAERVLAAPGHHHHHFQHKIHGSDMDSASSQQQNHLHNPYVNGNNYRTQLTGAVAKRPPSYQHHQRRLIPYVGAALQPTSETAALPGQDIYHQGNRSSSPNASKEVTRWQSTEAASKVHPQKSTGSSPRFYVARVPTSPVSSPVTPTYGPQQLATSCRPRISVSSLLNPAADRIDHPNPGL
jgi:hypothetical protein